MDVATVFGFFRSRSSPQNDEGAGLACNHYSLNRYYPPKAMKFMVNSSKKTPSETSALGVFFFLLAGGKIFLARRKKK